MNPSCRWTQHTRPFLHYRASDLLAEDEYARLARYFVKLLRSFEQDNDSKTRFVRSSARYDARVLGVNEDLASELAPFFSATWIDNIYSLFGYDNIRYVDGALHSSLPGSRTGWIHTDLCSAWFVDEQTTSTLTFPNRSACDYFTGVSKGGSVPVIELKRAAAMIYYLCNDGWEPGDGGETALYDCPFEGTFSPPFLVQPRNNSLLLFECSPHSYHRFISNTRNTRNSIILWIHGTPREISARWPSSTGHGS